MQMHKWGAKQFTAVKQSQICTVCGAVRWSYSWKWEPTTLNGKPQKYCPGKVTVKELVKLQEGK